MAKGFVHVVAYIWKLKLAVYISVIIELTLQCFLLLCFDAVGWAAGRASGL